MTGWVPHLQVPEDMAILPLRVMLPEELPISISCRPTLASWVLEARR